MRKNIGKLKSLLYVKLINPIMIVLTTIHCISPSDAFKFNTALHLVLAVSISLLFVSLGHLLIFLFVDIIYLELCLGKLYDFI